MPHRAPFRRITHGLVALSSMILVAGCGGDSTSTSTVGDSTVAELPSEMLQIPADWPSDVPVVGGGIAVSTSTGEGSDKTWVLEFYSDDLAKTWADAQDQLTGAGFTMVSTTTADDGAIDSVFESDRYMVMTKIYTEADTNEDEIRYVVSQIN